MILTNIKYLKAKTRTLLKFAGVGVPQTRQPVSAVSGPKFTILRGYVEEILLFNNFFPIVDTYLNCEDIARQGFAMDGQFLRSFCVLYFQRTAYSKLGLRLHHVSKYGIHPICGR